jgi:S1-C subfamily serine protease
VQGVEPQSAAARAGLRRGDLITAAAGTELTDLDGLSTALDALSEGQTLALHLVRGTEELDVVVRFDDAGGEGPSDSGASDIGDA